MVDKLMMLFITSAAEKEDIMSSDAPALSLIDALETKALFEATNVQKLEQSLRELEFIAAANVIEKYRLSQFPSPVPMKGSTFQGMYFKL